MQFERRMAVIDDGAFAALQAVLDRPFALASAVTDDAGSVLDIRVLRASPSFEETLGLDSLEGRTLLEAAPGRDRGWIALLGRVALERTPDRFSVTSTAGHEIEVAAAPLDPPGRLVMTVRDLTEARRIEEEHAAALDHAQHLLRELSHRVMNSFAAISAILGMESRRASPDARAALDRVQGRVHALGALYRRLDGAGRVDRIAAADYLGGIVESFRDSLASPAGVTVATDFAPVMLPTQAAVPLGLVANELLTNAVKHAFAPGQPGRVNVSLVEEEGRCRLVVEDDGKGMAEAVPGTGRGLLDAFVAELGGAISYETGPTGTRATVTFGL